VAIRLSLSLIAQILPVQPVEPAISELDAVDVLNRAFRYDLDGECISLPELHPLSGVYFVRDVHADDMLAVGNQMAVQPNLGAVVDPREFEQIDSVVRRRFECRPVPPILLLEILRYGLGHVLPNVEVGIDAVFLKDFQNRGGQPTDLFPIRVLIVDKGEFRSALLGTTCGL